MDLDYSISMLRLFFQDMYETESYEIQGGLRF